MEKRERNPNSRTTATLDPAEPSLIRPPSAASDHPRPFLFNTDWIGKDVYGARDVSDPAYTVGVRVGALGLMVNSVVQGAMSLAVEPLARFVRGVKRLWGIVNLVLAICFRWRGCLAVAPLLAPIPPFEPLLS